MARRLALFVVVLLFLSLGPSLGPGPFPVDQAVAALDPDADGDGYTDLDEFAISQDANVYCGIMRADVDQGGTVSILDLASVAGQFLQSIPPANPRFDQDGDAKISIFDLATMAGFFLQPVSSCAKDTLVAPPLDLSVPTTLCDASRFLYTGGGAVQTGMSPATIDCARVSVLRGRVKTSSDNPLSGVQVRVLGHPEFGQTLTRTAGLFDLAVNGGGTLTVVYEKAGYIPAQRQVETHWRQYSVLPDVVLLAFDPAVTLIDLTLPAPFQVARGSTITDGDGVRRATLLFPAGTTAQMQLSGGGTQPLTSLHVRATEYTVGPIGQEAMPAGALPPSSGYTYAVEFSVDEAVAAGATGVTFSQPLAQYLENFLHFPVGTTVPAGSYDRLTGIWVPEPNGRVIKIISLSAGSAQLDTDGDGNVDNDTSFGITAAERLQLGSLYSAGQVLWRSPVSHFSPWDLNWPYGPPADSKPPQAPPPKKKKDDCEDYYEVATNIKPPLDFTIEDMQSHLNSHPGDRFVNSDGTPILVPGQISAAGQDLAGTPVLVGPAGPSDIFNSVDLTRYHPPADVPKQNEGPKPKPKSEKDLLREQNELLREQNELLKKQLEEEKKKRMEQMDACVREASQTLVTAEEPVSGGGGNLHYNSGSQPGNTNPSQVGLQLSGATMPASAKGIKLQVQVAGRDIEASFSAAANQSTTFAWDGHDAYGRVVQGTQPARIRIGYTYDAEYQQPGQFARAFGGLSGVSVSADRARGEVTLWQEFETPLQVYDARAYAVGAWTLENHHFYDAAAGLLIKGDGTRRQVGGFSGDQVITRFAGGPPADADPGDGGSATSANLQPSALTGGPDGSVFIADSAHNTVRRVAPNGTISTFAGQTLQPCADSTLPCGDGGPATSAQLMQVSGLAVAPDGSVYIADANMNRVRRVAPNGVISTIAGTGVFGFGGDGGPATAAQLNQPAGVAVGPDGSIYIADADNWRLRRVAPDGTISTVAGLGCCTESGNDGPAKLAGVRPLSVAVAADGRIFIAGGSTIRVIGIDGIIRAFAGSIGQSGFTGDGGPAALAKLSNAVQGLSMGVDGIVYVTDGGNGRVRGVRSDGTIFTTAGSGGFFGSEDGPAQGSQLLSASGLSGGPDGSLYVSEAFGKEQTGSGRVRRVSPAFAGLTTGDVLVPSEDGSEAFKFSNGRHVQTLNGLTGATLLSFAYDGAGRLTSVTDASGNVTTVVRDGSGKPTKIDPPFGPDTLLSVDPSGRLASITNPAGESSGFTYDAKGLLLTATDARGNTDEYQYDAEGRLARHDDRANGFETYVRTLIPLGNKVVRTTKLGRVTETKVETLANGTERSTVTNPDGTIDVTDFMPGGVVKKTAADGMVVTTTSGPHPRFGMKVPIAASQVIATPAGSTRTTTRAMVATGIDPLNPLSFATETLTLAVNFDATTVAYVSGTKTFTTTTAENRVSTLRIDSLGRIVQQQTAGLNAIDLTYDASGRLSTTTEGSGLAARTTTFTYNPAGLAATITDPLNQVTQFGYDAAGRVTLITRPDTQSIAYGHDENGNLTSLTPPGKPAHTLTATALDAPSTYTPPSVGAGSTTETSLYNDDGQRTRLDRASGGSVILGYDAGGRPSTFQIASGTLTLGYDVRGRLASLSAPGNVALTRSFDGSLVTSDALSGALAASSDFTYENSLLPSSVGVNGGDQVGLTYDNDLLMGTVGGLNLTRSAQNGLVTGSSLGSVTDTYGYDAFGDLTSTSVSFNATPVFASTLERDRLGRVKKDTQTVGAGPTDVFEYAYDGAGRLQQVKKNTVVTATYGYDANGNRLSLTTGVTTNGTYDAQDRLATYGGLTYTYGSDGQLISKTTSPQATTYGYDGLMNLTSAAVPDGRVVSYLVDGLGRRTGKKIDGTLVQGFVYQDERPLAELSAGGSVVSRFIYGGSGLAPDYLVKGGNTYRLVKDWRGSVVLVIDVSTGAVAQRLDYDEFGRVTADTAPGFQPFGFAGGLYDADTKLVHLASKEYDAETGRWTARRFAAPSGLRTNLYVLPTP